MKSEQIVWRTPEGEIIACFEKNKVLRENLEEIRLICRDALEDAILMGCDEHQFRQALANVLAVLGEAGGKPEHVARLTWYVLDKQEYLAALADVGAAYRELMGRHYPVMTVVQVSGLVEDRARLEIEATAVVPE